MGIAGVALCALAAGGITSALTVPDGSDSAASNIIGAGHLAIEANQGQDADINLTNMIPGEAHTADQLITADLAGVDDAALTMTLSGASATPFATHASLAVAYGAPEPQSSGIWAGGTCSPTGGYTHDVTYQHIADLASAHATTLGTLTGTDDALCVRFTVTLDASADNSVQGSSGGFSMNYTLTQLAGGSP